MYSGDNTCRKKIFIICCFFLSVLLSFVTALLPLRANAISPAVNYYNAQYSAGVNANTWHNNIAQNTLFYPSYLYNYEWMVSSVNYTGNYANIHFETNIVLVGSPGPQSTSFINGRFHNRDLLTVKYCGSGGSNFTIKSQNVTSAKTDWYGVTPFQNFNANYKSNNTTLTVYGDVVISGLSASTTGNLYCGIGLSTGWAFAAVNNSDYSNTITTYFEQQPTTVTFTNDNSEALEWEKINAISSINEGEQQRWEQDKQDEAQKEQELKDQADSLSLSTPVTSNPFTSLFFSFNNGCQTFTRIPLLFNAPPQQICSPYPTVVKSAFSVVTSIVLAAFLIRLYYKHLRGGMNG